MSLQIIENTVVFSINLVVFLKCIFEAWSFDPIFSRLKST